MDENWGAGDPAEAGQRLRFPQQPGVQRSAAGTAPRVGAATRTGLCSTQRPSIAASVGPRHRVTPSCSRQTWPLGGARGACGSVWPVFVVSGAGVCPACPVVRNVWPFLETEHGS